MHRALDEGCVAAMIQLALHPVVLLLLGQPLSPKPAPTRRPGGDPEWVGGGSPAAAMPGGGGWGAGAAPGPRRKPPGGSRAPSRARRSSWGPAPACGSAAIVNSAVRSASLT